MKETYQFVPFDLHKKKVLVGLHTPILSNTVVTYLRKFGDNDVTIVDSLDDMIKAMEISSNDAPDCLPKNHFDVYVMDLNLGDYGVDSCESAERVYNHIKTYVEIKKIGFVGIYGTSMTIDAKGIPSIYTGDFRIMRDLYNNKTTFD